MHFNILDKKLRSSCSEDNQTFLNHQNSLIKSLVSQAHLNSTGEQFTQTTQAKRQLREVEWNFDSLGWKIDKTDSDVRLSQVTLLIQTIMYIYIQ